ncbi:hypothetical protein MROS_1331 [Melioribacter roseus P3M-2]|uniref:Uncharacterized protein n=1 Tax=Melioribacter roseus (strain DSM 23840 / JCM 17771 / VKM B-2668 / P3M-2) TaxID=1191523 RepID=I6ZZZ3_MELRP|nr:hypothetical protein MROS_1331 [Melioribacter roseus P3M-2]
MGSKPRENLISEKGKFETLISLLNNLPVPALLCKKKTPQNNCGKQSRRASLWLFLEKNSAVEIRRFTAG